MVNLNRKRVPDHRIGSLILLLAVGLVIFFVASDVHAWPWDRPAPASNVTPAPSAAPATPLLPLSEYFATDTITPSNQALLDKGLAACGNEDWALAIRYFTEARKSAPYYAPLLFNLGLAHSKAGNDLAAIAWFRSYLAIKPTDENRASIEGEIERLKSVVRGKISQIAATARITDPAAEAGMNHIKFLVQSGDLDIASELIKTLPPSDGGKLWIMLGNALIRKGDFAGAWRAARMAKDAGIVDYRIAHLLEPILDKALADEDMVFAENICLLNPSDNGWLLVSLAEKYVEMGNIAAAEATGVSSMRLVWPLLINRDLANARRIAERYLRDHPNNYLAVAILAMSHPLLNFKWRLSARGCKTPGAKKPSCPARQQKESHQWHDTGRVGEMGTSFI